MKALTSLLVLCAFVTPAAADDPDALVATLGRQIREAWYRDSETQAWLLADGASNGLEPAPCSQTLVKLRNLGVPASRTIELPDDSRDLRRGVHALPAVRKACDAIEHAGKIKEVERWIVLAAESTSVNNRKVFASCTATYDAAIAAGVSPTARVPERRIRIGRDLVMWTGTLAELVAKHCAAPMADVTAELAKRAAPYRAVLKHDKLRLALAYDVTAVYVLPGGDRSMSPKKLAAARVWFDTSSAPSNEVQHCADGRRRTLVRKYEFDRDHKLVRTTSSETCGMPVFR